MTGLSSIVTVGVLMFEAYLMWGPSSPSVSPAAAGQASPAAQQALDTEFSKAAAQVDVPPASPPPGTAKTPKAESAKAGNPEQALWSAFSDARHQVQSLTQEESAMAHNKGVRFFAANPGQQLTARFLDEAVRIESGAGGSWQGEMQLTAISKGERALALPKPSAPHAKGSRVEYQRGSVVEWYENMPEGFEHGYVIQEPVADGDTPLRVEVRMHGMVSKLTTPEQVTWQTADGVPVLSYNGLRVWDADGRAVAAHLAVGGQPDGIDIMVTDAGAAYPLTIDPLISTFEQKLGPEVTGSGAAEDRFGASVALSADTALIGMPGDDTPTGVDAGSAYVFVRTASLWSLQSRLRPASPAANSAFGMRTALSGGTALVATTTAEGGVIVFVRNGTTWTQQAVLNAGSQMMYLPPVSVALAGDTAVVGTPASEQAHVFFRSGTTWSLSATLQPAGSQPGDLFGSSVGVAGATAVVGAPGDGPSVNDGTGAAYIFVNSGTSWSQQQKLTAVDASTGDAFGSALAASGDTVLIGAPLDDTMAGNDAGSGYFFTRSGTVWSQQGVVNPLDAAAYDSFGAAVALAADRAVLGSPNRNSAYVFDLMGTGWTQQARLKVGDATCSDTLGASVAVLLDTVLLGAPGDDTRAGANAGTAFVFVLSDSDCCEPGDANNPASWCQQARLSPGDAAVNDFFGRPVAIQGNTAAIGAQGDDSPAGTNTGAVYIFERKGTVWSMDARLTARDGAAFDTMGWSVALHGSGDRVAAGAIGDDTAAGEDAGSVCIFGRMNGHWSQLARVTAPDGAPFDAFGRSVAYEDTTLLVGASGDDTAAGESAGSAYVFGGWDGINWYAGPKLEAFGASAFDNFGQSVALSGDTALIGAMGFDVGLTVNAGSAFVFVRNNGVWSQQAQVNATQFSPDDFFGHSVALSGDTALIGTSAADTTAGVDAGAAFVFTRSGSVWSQQKKLTPDDAAAGDQFGRYVALTGNTAVVTAPEDDNSGNTDTGSAYVFMRNGSTWTQEVKLLADDGSDADYFGSSVAVSGNTVLVGAQSDDGSDTLGEVAPDQGSVHVFRLWTSTGADIAVEHPLDTSLEHGVSSIDFGSVVVGGRVERVVYIRNLGAQKLTGIRATIDGAHRADFKIDAAPPTMLEPVGLTSFIVSFGPSAIGSRTANLRIVSNDPDENPFDIQLIGNGEEPQHPEIELNPVSLLVPLNSYASFTASAFGDPTPKLQWKRNNVPVAKATSSIFNFIATLSNVGTYTMTATNGGGSATTDPAELGVVDTSEKTLIRPTGGSAVMTVVSAGSGLSHVWLKDGELFSLHSRATVSPNGKTLTLTNLMTDDAGTYACQVTGPGGTLVGGTHHLYVIDGHPVIPEPVYMPSGMVGVPYTFTIPINPDPARAPASYGATGLSTGLTTNTVTGVISGIPTKSGLFNVVLRVTNIKGTFSVNTQLYISPLPCGTAGDFNGLVDRRGSLNGGFGGTITVKVDKTGTFTGALTLGSPDRLPFAGTLNISSGYMPGAPRQKAEFPMGLATARVNISRRPPLYPVTLEFSINYYEGTLMGTILDPWCQPGKISPFVGQPDISGSQDGAGTEALFNGPRGMVLDRANNLFVADSLNHVIRKVTVYGVVTTFAGTPGLCGSTDGSGPEALFHSPEGLAIDEDDNLYVTDTCNSTIRKITPYGEVTTVAGSAGIRGSVNGIGIAARFVCPTGVAVDTDGNLYVTDFSDHTIRKITPARVVTTFAGKSGTPGSANGGGAAARFDEPYGITISKKKGTKGSLYVTDSGNHTIRAISLSGAVTTFAGAAGVPGSSEGILANARFHSPAGITFDGVDNLFVTDAGSHLLRRISFQGIVCNVAGRVGVSGWENGTGSEVLFDRPVGIVFRPDGWHYLTEMGAHSVRMGSFDAPMEVNVFARRNPWGSDVIPDHPDEGSSYCYNPPATHLAGTYNVALELPSPLAGNQAYPQGNGFGTMTVTTRGTVNWVGVMADGTATTCSTMLGGSQYSSYINYVPLHFMLYRNTGSAQGWQEMMSGYDMGGTAQADSMGEVLIDGVLDWYKIPEALPASRSYAQGIPLHVQSTIGEENRPPDSGHVVLGFGSPPGNGLLSFSEGGIGTGFGQYINISTSNTVTFPSSNPNNVKMTTFNAATSKFAGNFTLVGSGMEPSPPSTKKIATSTSITRTASFNGVLLRRLNRGVGYFLLNQLPSSGPPPTTLTTSPILSGQVVLEDGD